VHDSFLSSESLQEISQLRNLRRLSLDYSYFPAESLQHLSSLSRLEDLDLDQTTLKDEPLIWLPELPALKRLSVQESNLTAAALGNIARCKRLELLAVDNLSEDGLRTLSNMPRLRGIYVSAPNRTESSIPKNHYGWKVEGDTLNGHWLLSRDVGAP
jgi:Leucine-rich repeat (LRR) protein